MLKSQKFYFYTFILIILTITLTSSFTSASSIGFDCPSLVKVNEEFVCYLEIIEGQGVYDVKIELIKDGKTIARIWNQDKESFQSTYYYLKEFIQIEEKKEIKLIVQEQGNFNGILKLKQNAKTETFNFI